MKKAKMIEFINEHYDWFERMQNGLGHHSWWYTNRSPEDCINVKIHAWVDVDKVKQALGDDHLKIAKLLGVDIDQHCNDIIWSDFGLVDDTKRWLLEDLKERYNVSDLEYGGKSGGWLAVVYQWDDVPSDYQDDYTYIEVKEFYQAVKKAIKENDQVTADVLEAKKHLENQIETDIDYYVDPLVDYLEDRKEQHIAISKALAI